MESITQSKIRQGNGLVTELNHAQREAVSHEGGPLLIVAGAGTGKTTVITKRIAWLILLKGLKPENILALTFTDKAATEMEERVDRLLPYGYVELWISTFHSFAERILKEHAMEIGLSTDFKLLDTTAAWLLVRRNLHRFNLKYYKPLGNPTKFIHALLTHFSRAKDELVGAGEYLKYVEELKLNTDSELVIGGEKVSGELRGEELVRLLEIASAYHVYEQLLLEENAMDFGGLMNAAVELLKMRPKILEKYRAQFKYILVDEFQDTNHAQYELVKLLAAPRNNLTVVGDDDQCLIAGTKIATIIGNKRIENIRQGDKILTAVGKGYVGHSEVSRVMKTKKSVRLLSIKTKEGSVITVTDNHKMFCYVPRIDDCERTYVYLMHSIRLGWRIGVTNDLAMRLRLERGADRIVGLRVFEDSKEAHYYEMLWGLMYQIPPVCFKERDGVYIRGKWLDQLFKTIDTETNAKKLAKDFRIDLSSHHYALDSVTRSKGRRIKIHYELCHRNYISKQKIPRLIKHPKIVHQISLETSDLDVIKKIKNAKISYTMQKGRIRVRKTNTNIKILDTFAAHLVEITGGFIEYSFKLGRKNTQTLEALAMPAGNLLVGHFLPVKKGYRIEYQKIVEIIDGGFKNTTVYDLEVGKTHNFIANNIVVHNSVYKFRGASISNILEFKKDFPQSREIFLTENYRSAQPILDLAYQFIQQNNPNRLEVRLGGVISKKLKAVEGRASVIRHLHADTLHGEAHRVAQTILDLKEKNTDMTWNDCAVLVRANDHAGIFIRTFDERGIPYELVTVRGLYTEPVIMDLLAYAKLLDDYRESPALYRVLTSPIARLEDGAISELLHWAHKKSVSLFEALQHAGVLGLDNNAVAECQRLVGLIEKHTARARRERASTMLFVILEDTGYLKELSYEDSEENRKALRHVNQLYRKVTVFETEERERTLKRFLDTIFLEIEAGEEGKIAKDPHEGPETVKILTVHAAKGLEFRYVFVVNMVDRRFPTNERREPIELPDALVKEIITEGDAHLEEERRLFYVACTRAKEGLFFTSADDYGGTRKKKLSRFLLELQELGYGKVIASEAKQSREVMKREMNTPKKQKEPLISLSDKFSFTQLKAFEMCPLQYKFAHILKIPVKGRATFSFGKTIHATLQKFCELIKTRNAHEQGDIFGSSSMVHTMEPPGVSLEELNALYDASWIDDWFADETQKKEYYEKGKTLLRLFYETTLKNPPRPRYIEQVFHLKIDGYTLKGVIDRVDLRPDGTLEVIDYKTGPSKEKPEPDQLYLYQLALDEVFHEKPGLLTYYYVEDGNRVSFLGTSEDLEKTKNKIRARIEEIKKSSFPATPSKHICHSCDFKDICQFRIL